MAAQRALIGHGQLKSDGVMPGTRQAIEKFAERKLAVTGGAQPRTARARGPNWNRRMRAFVRGAAIYEPTTRAHLLCCASDAVLRRRGSAEAGAIFVEG